MDKNDLKVGDKIRHKVSGNTYIIEKLLEDSFCLIVEDEKWVFPYRNLSYYEKDLIITIDKAASKQLQKEGARLSEKKPICYNHIKVTQLIETLKQLAQINELDINNLTILKTSYNPDDGSMLFDIKLN